MGTVERYIFAVTRRLPVKAREEVSLELRGLIEDLLEERVRGQKVSENDVKAVLLELGNPEDLAREYGGEPRYLIGPTLFDTYLTVLKTVGSIVLAVVQTVVVIRAFVSPIGIVEFIASFLGSLVAASAQVFVWVTLIFAAVEHFGKEELDQAAKGEWSPEQLPEVPDQKRQISLGDPMMGIAFSVLFLVMYTMPQRIGVIQMAGGTTTVIPVVNLAMTSYFLPFLIGFIGITVIKEGCKLFWRVWSKRLAIISAVCNGAAIILAYQIFANREFWNPSFVQQLLSANVAPGSGAAEILQWLWPFVTTRFVYVIVIAYVIDTLSALYRGFIADREG